MITSENSYHYELSAKISGLVQSVIDDDEYGAEEYCDDAKLVCRSMDDSESYSKFQMNLVFLDFFNLVSEESINGVMDSRRVVTCMSYFKEIYGDTNLIIAELYTSISATHIKNGNAAAALDNAGKALLIRVQRLGVLHEKTAASHYLMGSIQLELGQTQAARRELNISRGIRCKIHGEISLPVADCDIITGKLEMESSKDVKAAYVSFYRAFKARMLLLGASDSKTVAAEELMLTHRTHKGERLVSGLELKDRVTELCWDTAATNSWQYGISLFVHRIEDSAVLNLYQVKGLVSSAVNFSVVRLGASELPAGGTVSVTTEYPLLTDNVSGAAGVAGVVAGGGEVGTTSPLTATASTNIPASSPNTFQQEQQQLLQPQTSQDHRNNEINVLAAMLMMAPAPVMPPGGKATTSLPSSSLLLSSSSPSSSAGFHSSTDKHNTRGGLDPAISSTEAASLVRLDSSSSHTPTISTEHGAAAISGSVGAEADPIAVRLAALGAAIDSVRHSPVLAKIHSPSSSLTKHNNLNTTSSSSKTKLNESGGSRGVSNVNGNKGQEDDHDDDGDDDSSVGPESPPTTPKRPAPRNSAAAAALAAVTAERSADVTANSDNEAEMQGSHNITQQDSSASSNNRSVAQDIEAELKQLSMENTQLPVEAVAVPVTSRIPYAVPPEVAAAVEEVMARDGLLGTSTAGTTDADGQYEAEAESKRCAAAATTATTAITSCIEALSINTSNLSLSCATAANAENSNSSSRSGSPSRFGDRMRSITQPQNDEQRLVTLKSKVASPVSPSALSPTHREPAELSHSAVGAGLNSNWQPIKSPYLSNAYRTRQGQTPKLDVTLTVGTPYVFARDAAGTLVVVQKASASVLRDCLKPNIVALGIFPWFAADNKHSLKHSPATSSSRRTSLQESTSVDADQRANVLSALFAKGGAAAGKGGGRSSRRGSSSSSKSAKSSKAKKKRPSRAASGATELDSNTPIPPPLPVTWPPEPYTGVISGTVGETSSGIAVLDKDGNPVDTAVAAGSEKELLAQVLAKAMAGNAPVKPKLKQVYLDGLTTIEGTLWEDAAAGEELVKFDVLFEDIEDEFMSGKPKTKKPLSQTPFGAPAGGGGGAGGLSGNKPTRKKLAESVLDPQRAQNLNIMLAKLGKRSYFDIAKAIKDFDSEKLSTGTVASLQQFIPSEDEVKKVTEFLRKKYAETKTGASDVKSGASENTAQLADSGEAGDGKGDKSSDSAADNSNTATATTAAATTAAKVSTEELRGLDHTALQQMKIGKPEQFIFVMSSIEKLDVRLSAMSLAASAPESSKAILSGAEAVLRAVSEVRGSMRLKFFLKTFLDLTNSLASKSGKNKGVEMAGFKLSSLDALRQTKSNSGETVEQYVVRKVGLHLPEALEVASDMPSLDEARVIKFTRLNADMRKIEEAVKMMGVIIEIDEKTNNQLTESTEQSTQALEGGAQQVTAADGGGVSDDNKESSSNSGSANSSGARSSGASSNSASEPSQIQIMLSSCEKIFKKTAETLKEAQSDFKDLCDYFGEDAAVATPEVVFSYIADFVRGIKNATAAASKAKRRARPKIELPAMVLK